MASDLTFKEGGGEGVSVTCDVTLNASLHATVTKARNEVVGWIKEGRTADCTSTLGSTTIIVLARLEQPATWWPIRYESFAGTLPGAISRVGLYIADIAMLLRGDAIITVVGCLLFGDLFVIPGVTGGTSIDSILVAFELIPLLRQLEGFVACPASGTLEGDPFMLQTTNTVRLI